jgi:hypothetical protein
MTTLLTVRQGVAGVSVVAAAIAAAVVLGGQTPAAKFRAQAIATEFGVGYAVVTGDMNGDKRTDIVAINATDLVWFQAPTWEKHVIIGKGSTVADNVTLALHDVDRDGRLDVALGAGWTGQNTGTLQWVRQNAPGTTPAWEVFPIGAERTLHRIRWADVDGNGSLELIVAPLHGADNKGPAWEGQGVRLLVFRPSANPSKDPWASEVADNQNHILHNFLPVNLDADKQEELVTASREGLFVIKRRPDGTWSRTQIGEGAPGEVKVGRVGGRRLFATVEPWHGNGIAIYAEQPQGLWAKTVIESALLEGHALGWADFDGDGNDELVAGWRGAKAPGLALYAVNRDGTLRAKTMIDEGGVSKDPATMGMATEDLTIADLNGDKQPDIVAAGRITRNIKIYWNETKGK